MTGQTLGPYRVLEKIGEGGMGEVYRARDTRLDRTVAIKVLPPGLASQPGFRERFEREARAIAAFNHPHICVLHDIGHEDGVDFLVMEHIAGESLADRLKKGPLPFNQVLQYGIEIADALDRAHREGIVHRDLKPANVMLVGAGARSGASHLKLLDFGLAKLRPSAVAAGGISEAFTEQRDLTGAGAFVGTLHYMAPEQLEGKDADARSDIFAFGAVLYEMATGRKAFEGKTQVSVIAAILEHEPAPLRDLQPLTPPAFEHLVTTCLSKSPDDRWQTARDVATQLRWIATAGGAQPAAPPTAPVKRRRWAMWGAAALTTVVLLTSGFIAMRHRNDSQPQQVMRFEIPTPPIANGVFMTMMALSPDGRSLAFSYAERGTTIPTLWIRRIDSVEAQKVAGTEGAGYPFWSPDSQYVGFAALGRLKRIDVSGGPPQTICEIPAGNFAGGAWNVDGVIVFGGLSPLMRVSASGGRPVPLTTLDSSAGEVAHGWPTFLPDGRHLLFLAGASGAGPRQIKAVALDSPKPQTVLAANSRPLYSPSGHLLFHRDGTLMAQRFDAATRTLSGEPVRIADGLAFTPFGAVAASVSETGLLATRSGAAFEPTQLTWFDSHGARLGMVGEQAVYRGLGLSPDNQYVAVHIHQEPSGGDVWVIDLQRGSSTRYTFNAHNFAPSWSHDGKYVMFSSDREGSGLNLYRKPAGAAGGDEMMLGSGSAAFVEDLTPDGKWMVYGAATAKNGIDIMRVSLTEKGDPQTVVSTPFFDGLSKISPDGRWIAYESDESGRREIYAQPYPSGTAKWQISTDGGRYVRWSPKGNELFYLKDDGTMMAAEVRAQGDALVANTPKPLFKTNPLLANHRGSALDIPYDVSRDAQRFLVNERIRAADSQSPISVVVNWPALLNR